MATERFECKLQTNGAPITLLDKYTLMIRPNRLRPVGPPKLHELVVTLTDLESGAHHMRLGWTMPLSDGRLEFGECAAVLDPTIPPTEGGPVLASFLHTDFTEPYTSPSGKRREGIVHTLHVMPAYRLPGLAKLAAEADAIALADLRAKHVSLLNAVYLTWYDNR